MENYNVIKRRIEKEAKRYLQKFSLDFSFDNDAIFDEHWIGQYENNSVFSGTVTVIINDEELQKSVTNDELESALRVTVFHEIGHGFFQYVNSLSDNIISPYFKEFFDIFYDDNNVDEDEEDICEEFGFSFDSTYCKLIDKSLLRELIDQMLNDGVEFNS